MAINPLWRALAELAPAEAPSTRYLLINQAAWNGQPQVMRALRCFNRQPLLTHDLDACEDGATPFLVEWEDGERHTTLLRRLCDTGCYACGLSVLQTAMALSDLAAALSLRCEVGMSDGQNVLLRYFDTRVVSQLPAVLTFDQMQAFVSCVDRWLYADRQGGLVEIDVDPWPSRDSFKVPWRTTAVQERLLLEASEADAMLDLLTRHRLPELLDLAYPDRRDAVHRLLEDARSWGLEGTPDQAAFCSLGLREGIEVFRTAYWSGLHVKVKQGDLAVLDALREHESSRR